MAREPSYRLLALLKPALALVSVGLVLLIAEGTARIFWKSPQSSAQPKIPREWDGLPDLKGLFVLSKPNLRGLMKGALFETNSHGFRGPERSHQKPSGIFRISLIGDSVTMGAGVLEEDTYAAGLERTLNRERADQRYEVLNIGLSGLNTHWVVRRFEELGLPFDPDMVIYGFTINDIESAFYRRSYDVQVGSPFRYQDSPLHLWRILGPSWRSLHELIHAPVGSYVHELDQNYFHNPEAWEYMLASLDRLRDTSRQRNMCAVVFLHTALTSLNFLHPFHKQYNAVARAAEERGFHVIQSFRAFRPSLTRRATELWISPVDSHPNAAGHEILAEALFHGLESLPEACWRRVP